MNDERDRPPGAEEAQEILAYLEGELPPVRAAEFEARLAGDEQLRREVEATRDALQAARQWMAEPAPGIERAQEIAPPPLNFTVRPVPYAAPESSPQASVAHGVLLSRWLGRAAAAAAIFVAGFAVGTAGVGGSPQQPPPSAERTIDSPIEAARPEPVAYPTGKTSPDPSTTERESPTALASETRLASVAGMRRVREENGRLIIETTLPSSGVRAMFVVDANFRLNRRASEFEGAMP